MTKLSHLIIVVFLIVFCSQSVAQHERFQRFVAGSDALKKHSGTLNALAQDPLGFMWLGSEDGLIRFDGSEYRYYNKGDDSHLTSNMINALDVDQNGTLWAGTDQGLNRYYPRHDRFEVLGLNFNSGNSLPHSVVTSIAIDKDNVLIMGTPNGLSFYNSHQRRFTNLPIAPKHDKALFVLKVFLDSKNRLWVGTRESGLYLFSDQRQLLHHFTADRQNPKSLQSNTVKTIAEDAFGRIWVGTLNGGLSRILEGERSFYTYFYDPSKAGSIGSNSIWNIYRDSQDTLWVTTDQGGLAKYLVESDEFYHFRHQPGDPYSLISNKTKLIYEDNQNNLWVTTFPEGLHFYDRSHSAVTNYTHDVNNPTSLSHNAVLDFLLSSDGYLWIGTERGLNQFDLSTKEVIRHYFHTPGKSNGIQANAVLSLEEDLNGDLWIGTWSGGLHRYDRVNEQFTHYFPTHSKDDHYINSAFIWDIHLDNSGTLWVATESGGLNRFNRDSQTFTAFVNEAGKVNSISNNFVWKVIEDAQQRFWIATADGLDLMDRDKGTFKRLSTLEAPLGISSMRIRSMAEHSNGNIWIGTQDNGIFVYENNSATFRQVELGRWLSPFVTSLIEDNQRYMWAATANGLARIDPTTYEVRAFNKSHGLSSNHFNRDATFKDKRGVLYFGSTEGFSVFDPREFAKPEIEAPLVIKDFRLFNRPVGIGGDSPLEQSILYTDTIVLGHEQTMFSFSYASLNFRSAKYNEFAYMLEGFDHEWHQVGKTTVATYTNIEPGDYTFKVRNAGRDGLWNDQSAQIKLKILPPPWLNRWAYIIYAIIIALIFFVSIRIFLRQVEFKNQKALNAELLRVGKIKDAFILGVSKDLRLPTSSLIQVGESLLQDQAIKLEGSVRRRLQLMVSNGKRLSQLINNIVDYSGEADQALKPFMKVINLHTVTEEVLSNLRTSAYEKSLDLTNRVSESECWVYADKNHLHQILTSLVANAIRYSDSGEICIDAEMNDDKLLVKVSDNGVGISAELQRQILTNEVPESEAEDIYGLGLGLSISKHLIELHEGKLSIESRNKKNGKEESGTIISFTLPLAMRSEIPSRIEVTIADIKEPVLKEVHKEQAHEQSETPLPSPNKKSATHLSAPGQHSVLIVDDDPVNRMVLGGILSLNKLKVIEAGSGPEALNILFSDNNTQVDLVILDVMMPRMNGFEVCEKIRQKYSKADLPVVFITAKHGEDDYNRGLEVGANDVLFKPVNKTVLLPKVEELLNSPIILNKNVS